MVIFNSYVTVYQRVCGISHEKPWFPLGVCQFFLGRDESHVELPKSSRNIMAIYGGPIFFLRESFQLNLWFIGNRIWS